MFAEPVSREETPGLDSDGLSVNMEFSGPISGGLTLAASREAAAEIAANILGVDADDIVAQRGGEDALKELLNVICGRLLTALAGEGPIFNLSVPQASPLQPAEWVVLLQVPGTLAFQVDGLPLLLRVVLYPEG
jgi:chemotaxis protein CheY-P-specific phosphatase CheC